MPPAAARARLDGRPDRRRLVPIEHIGRARSLIRTVTAGHAEFKPAADRLLEPFRPRPGFTPVPANRHLRWLVEDWRALPALGRLRLVAVFDQDKRKLQIIELRAAPTTISAHGWEEDEPALAVTLRGIVVEPPAFRETRATWACVGLHALARRFQRGRDRSDEAVLADLFPLGRGGIAAYRAGGEFRIPAPGGGRWIGSAVANRAESVCVRTFVA